MLTVPVAFSKFVDLAGSGTDIRLRLLVEDDNASSDFIFSISGDFAHLFEIVKDTENPALAENTTAFKLALKEGAELSFGDLNGFNLDISVSDGDTDTDPNAHSSETRQVQIEKNNPPTLTLIQSNGIVRENEWIAVKTDASFQLSDIDVDDSAADFTFKVYDNGALSEYFEVVYDEDTGQYFIWQTATTFLDYETIPQHNLTIEAIDQYGAVSNSLNFKIDVENDENEVVVEQFEIIFDRGTEFIVLDDSNLKVTFELTSTPEEEEVRLFLRGLPDESVTLLFDGNPIATNSFGLPTMDGNDFEFSQDDIDNGRFSIEIADPTADIDTFIPIRIWQGGRILQMPVVSRKLDDTATSEFADIVDASEETAPLTIATSDGRDTITTGFGDDYVEAGRGVDVIHLDNDASASSEDSVFYTIGTLKSGIITARDGADTIHNFELGEDKLILRGREDNLGDGTTESLLKALDDGCA